MPLTFDYNNILSTQIGPKHGFTAAQLKSAVKKDSRVWDAVKKDRASGKLKFMV